MSWIDGDIHRDCRLERWQRVQAVDQGLSGIAPPTSVGVEVLFELEGPVARVRLNRPGSHNAVNGAVTRAMGWIISEVERNRSIVVAVLESTTPGMFCAGADLAEIARGNGADLLSEVGGFGGFVKAHRTKAWIAAVDGPAMGGGFEFALACDMIVASDRAKFALPEVKRGLMAMAGGAIRLPRIIPRALALEAIATGEPISAQIAFSHGMINRLVSPDQLDAATHDLANKVAANAPLALRESLTLARMASGSGEAELWQANDQALARVVRSDDAREGPRAFLEKRAPKWSDN